MAALVPLPRAFYARPTVVVARDLLGQILVRRAGGRELRARIVEVEAYLGERDAASHARHGPTPRSAIMFGPPGFVYVYLIYGMYHCMNCVTETDGVAGAVLIRAAELLEATTRARCAGRASCAASWASPWPTKGSISRRPKAPCSWPTPDSPPRASVARRAWASTTRDGGRRATCGSLCRATPASRGRAPSRDDDSSSGA